MEIFCDFFVLLIAFGIALDDRQRQIFPPYFPPFIIGITISLVIYTTGAFSPYSTGAISYPTRCFGPAVAMGLLTDDHFYMANGVRVGNAQWIYWVGPAISSCMIAALYRFIPPGYMLILQEERERKQLAAAAAANGNSGDNNNNEIPMSSTVAI